ncbi:MAG: hypothetical protein P1U46_03940 [Patescibacteria group bacterium]|nr:hypothetical protein [Patescibacteria group bacterium]
MKNSVAHHSTNESIYFCTSLAFFHLLENHNHTIFLNIDFFIILKLSLLYIFKKKIKDKL